VAHPIIGVWTAEARYEGWSRVDRPTIAFHADGTVSITAFDRSHHGIWLASGDSSA